MIALLFGVIGFVALFMVWKQSAYLEKEFGKDTPKYVGILGFISLAISVVFNQMWLYKNNRRMFWEFTIRDLIG